MITINSNRKIIEQAMNLRKSISAYYDGQYRLLSPYDLGYKNNRLQCLFYQFGGESNSRPIIAGSDKNWRCMELNRLHEVKILDECLHKPYQMPSKHSSCIDVSIKKIWFD